MPNPKREFTIDELKLKESTTVEVKRTTPTDFKLTESSTVSNVFGYIKTTNANNDTSFMMTDFFGDNPGVEAIEIYDIFVEPEFRHSGIGTKLIDYVAAQNADKVILTAAGASMKEYPEEPSDEEKLKVVADLHDFYSKNNFVSVNKRYGGYEFKHAYMYLNEPGKKILEKIEKEVLEDEKKED